MLIKRKYLFGTTILAGVMAVAAPALAQTAPTSSQQQDQRTSQSSNTQDSAELGEVVVTGTRIRNPEYTSASAVQVLTSENADARGIPDVAQALLNSTLAVSSFQLNDQLTGYVTAGGGGTQSVALRGAGPQRTLTLLNGRRAGPAGTRGQVQAFDLGVIPGGVLERTEILKDGASAIYGSDAVAGVINIITRRDLDGGSMNAFYSQPFEDGGEQLRLDASFGRTFERGYFNIAAEYAKTYIQRRGDRDYTSCTLDLLRDPITGQRLDYIDPITGDYKCYNLNTNYVSLLTTGQNIVRMQPGYTYPTALQGNNVRADLSTEWARFNRAGFPLTYQYTPSDHPLWREASVISPNERQSIFLSAGFDLTENVELYGEFLYNNRQSSQIGVAQVFQSFAQRNIVSGAGNFLPASNPNNPFGENVQTVAPYASSSFQDVDYYRGVIGLRGTFGDWDWDVYGQYSLSDADYNNGPRIYLDRFLALNSPNVACTNTPLGGNVSNFDCSALPGGIPWTSARVLAGDFTDAERNFLFFTENNTTTYDHAYIEGTISTPSLFTLPAGDVGAAFGVQYRKEEIDDTPGAQAILRNTALYTTSGRTAGSDTIKEAFAELDIPLLANMPWFDDLRLNLSGRLSDYESYGSSETYKVGLNWAVTPEVRFRSSYGTSFRAPALYEQFLGAQVGYQGQTIDPCYNYLENESIDPAVLAGCIADGANTTLGGSSVAVSSVGGRGVLTAETADNFTIGFVITPQTLPISVAVDYYEFTVNDAVSQLGATEIITRCYQGRTAFCDLYTRVGGTGADAGRLATVNNSYTNVSEQNNRGIDVQARWSEEYSFGRLTIESAHNFKLEDSEVIEGETTNFDGRTFNLGGPAYSGNLYMTLSRGDFSYFYGIDVIGSGSDVADQGGVIFGNSKYVAPNGVLYDFETPVWTTHSASIRYSNDAGWTASVGVQNLWDESPPIMGAANFRVGTAALNGYDMRGRRLSLRIGRRF
ncbi:TonB-dependent receptor plug domain-containing protein [Brevundimonas sp. GCM10030266]|uniref:TonB-dependent receptor plug domain-containing protein n=1 Tax=Brevundimonas sp. GCM10030266 TaxID=3273386 RepID=UPI00361E75A1